MRLVGAGATVTTGDILAGSFGGHGMVRIPRRAHYLEPAPAPARRYGTGWTFYLAAHTDASQDHIIVRLFSPDLSFTPTGWCGGWFDSSVGRTVESFIDDRRDVVLSWARSTGVAQIFVENPQTGQLEWA